MGIEVMKKILHPFSAQEIASVPVFLITHPIAEIALVFLGHGRKVSVEIPKNHFMILLTPQSPAVFILLIKLPVAHQHLLKTHGDPLRLFKYSNKIKKKSSFLPVPKDPGFQTHMMILRIFLIPYLFPLIQMQKHP